MVLTEGITLDKFLELSPKSWWEKISHQDPIHDV